MGLLDYFGLIRSTVIQQMLVASGVNDRHRVATLAGRAVEVLRELGRVSGELRDVPRGHDKLGPWAMRRALEFVRLAA